MNLKTVMALCLTGLLTACGPSEPAPSSEPAEAAAPEPSTSMETEPMTQDTDPLTGTSWQVEDIAGGGVIDRSPATVVFPEPGRVAGNSSCNRYMGGYEREGDALTFGNLAGTMMACPEALMDQERRFYEAMDRVTGWRIDASTGLLHLVDGSGETVIRASEKAPEENPG
ncbi:MAG: META domain-containing protein [Xanthomonadales bacterium]|jgi:heat shock protein HslJ|nr:META domain-containing protein [Xanthomonadales bacterium]